MFIYVNAVCILLDSQFVIAIDDGVTSGQQCQMPSKGWTDARVGMYRKMEMFMAYRQTH